MQEPPSFTKFAGLPTPLQQILPPSCTYKIKNYVELEPIITTENVNIGQINVDLYVDLNTNEGALKWLEEFQEISKTTMRLTRTFSVKGSKVIFRELRHC